MTDPVSFNPLQHEPMLIVISGPSGVGKDSVIQRMKERKLPFHFVVTATTRRQRAGEPHHALPQLPPLGRAGARHAPAAARQGDGRQRE